MVCRNFRGTFNISRCQVEVEGDVAAKRKGKRKHYSSLKQHVSPGFWIEQVMLPTDRYQNGPV